MPQDLDYNLYFNLIYFGVIGLGFLIGYFRGLRKTLYNLIVMLIIYIFFFATIDSVVAYLWRAEIPSLINYATSLMPELSGVSTLGDAVFTLVDVYAGDVLGSGASNDVLIDLITGLSMFIIKLIYAVFYFTIGIVLLRLFFWIIRLMFFNKPSKTVIMDYLGNERVLKGTKDKRKYEKEFKKHKKRRKKVYKELSRKERKHYKKEQVLLAKKQKKFEKKQRIKEKRQVLSAFVGAGKGAVGAFVSIIMIGGFLNISESFLTFIPDSTANNTQIVENYLLSNDFDPFEERTPIMLADEPDPLGGLSDTLQTFKAFTYAYNNNEFVKFAGTLNVSDDNYSKKIPLNLYLFDRVFSFLIDDEKVMLRYELNNIADVGEIFMTSEFSQTNNVSDIEGEEIEALFTTMSNSSFLTKTIPLAIDLGSDYFEVPLSIPKDDLYAIDWSSEIAQLGAVASTLFDIVNTAGLLSEERDLTTVTLDGTEVRGLFDALSESELVTLSAYVAVEPLLSDLGGQVDAIIDVPEGLEWEDEFKAFGEVAEAILNTNITVSELQSSDPSVLISALSTLDFTVLLNSDIVSHALKNILDGTAGIDGLDVIVIPDDIEWFDTYTTEGDIDTPGELRLILEAINEITDVASDFDFTSFSLEIISAFDDTTIDTLFNSEVLVASISDYVFNLDLGDVPIVIPDSVIDDNGYLLSSELKSIAQSAVVLVEELACEEGDTACENLGIDIAKAFNLSDTSIDTLTSSEILGASVGQLIIDNGGDILTIPNRAMTAINVDEVPQNVVSKDEINRLFNAVSVLGFDDLETMAFDASIVNNLIEDGTENTLDTDASNTLFDSYIVHATLSDMLFEQASGDNAILVVPYYAQEEIDDPLTEDIIQYNAIDDLNYVSTNELNTLLQSFLTLDITDFTTVESLDISSVISDASTLLNSSILQATISKQVVDLGDEIITIPEQDILGNNIRFTVGDPLLETDTLYIDKDEIVAMLDALELLGLSDLTTFDGSFDLSVVFGSEANQNKLLDSATIHATFSENILTLGGDILVVPNYTQAGETPGNEVRKTVGSVEYITKTEIKALIDALVSMGYEDLDSFDIETVSTEFFNNRETLLASATIQATISDKLINDTGDLLAIPDVYYGTSDPIRIVQSDVTYVDYDEIINILDALDALGLTDFTSLSFDPSTVFSADFGVVLESASLQATISENILPSAGDETTPAGTLSLIIPTYYRQSILVDGVAQDQIEQLELQQLLEGLEAIGLGDFSSGLDATTITSMTNTELDTLLTSASIHTTADNMLRGNSFIDIPELAEDSFVYKTTVTTRDEIKYFIQAVQAISAGDFTNASFNDVLALAALDAAGRDTVATSMIVRNTMNSSIETYAGLISYPLAPSDYMDADTNTFLIKSTFLDILD
jgi:hypothetical protein